MAMFGRDVVVVMFLLGKCPYSSEALAEERGWVVFGWNVAPF
jgi:hypothetical protein